MSCKCKQKLEKLDEIENGKENQEDDNIFSKIFQSILQMIFGLFVGGLIVICVIPLLIYFIFCLMIGKDISVNISKIISALSQKSKDE